MSKEENITRKLKVNIDISAEDLLQLHEVRIKDFQLIFLNFFCYFPITDRHGREGRSIICPADRQSLDQERVNNLLLKFITMTVLHFHGILFG